MRFGIRIFGQHSPERAPTENFETCLEQVRAARDSGFDLLWCGHHYATDRWQKFQVIPSIARFAAEAPGMYVGTAFLLPLHHPLVVAEQFATLDAMTDGKVIFGPVAGYRNVEFDALGISKAERASRLTEGIEAIKRLWTEEEVTFDGEHFSFQDVTIRPRPVQNPHPPIWIGANADSAVVRAGSLGDAWLANPHADNKTIARQIELTKRPQGPGFHGLQPGRREIFVADSDDEAMRIYGRAVKEYYDWYETAGQGKAMENPDDLSLAVEKLRADRFIIGSPDTVADELVALYDDVGLDCVIAAMQMPSIRNEDVLESIRLMGDEVIPRVRERL